MKCVVCGCTDHDCGGCIERTGEACHWAEDRICSACTGQMLIALERERQVNEERFTSERDDAYTKGQLARAARCYASPPATRVWRRVSLFKACSNERRMRVPKSWPFYADWWKPSPRRRVRELVKAGALFLAESARLSRLGRVRPSAGMLVKAKACARQIDRLHRARRDKR